MNDLIRRVDAIDAIERTGWYHQAPNGEMVHGANSAKHQAWYKEQDVYKALENVPTAQRWIPVTERLPDENKWYIISNGLDSWVAIWSKENKEWLSVTGLDYTIMDVVAWMAFPEPYKEGGDV